MSRERRKRILNREDNFKSLLYLSGSILGIAIITFVITFVVYGNKMNKVQNDSIDIQKIADLVPNETNTNNSIAEASSKIGKTVEESQNALQENNIINNTIKTEEQNKITNSVNNSISNNIAVVTNKPEEKVEEKDPVFIKPVEGEITKEFAKENLIYSETLKEWITHKGIDIKAEKTTVVKSAADGKVTAIKNDPRYGLTVIVEHIKGYKTVYSNLLTAEFVAIGEEIKSGQTIGTVGTTSTFEISDGPHLHFEILKDNENVDPSIYIK